ncbi:structural maintenance of chromosomes protein 2-1-like [Cucumis melo var. makuwa]|uniref:Structural maintenance of chromosomes protein 2-1-like n=1 Tax=Cucumis melo var. makuwa TaxID=1194695 RepID=A0A5D3BVC1_CUCMM|nr:structural maintenance of chromosomes protein 2-1-like [Cucumis melo var. makuwa]
MHLLLLPTFIHEIWTSSSFILLSNFRNPLSSLPFSLSLSSARHLSLSSSITPQPIDYIRSRASAGRWSFMNDTLTLSLSLAAQTGHENEREKLVIKMEAVIQEKASLEAKLVALKIQVNSLSLEIEEQKAKVFSIKSNNGHAQSMEKLKTLEAQRSSLEERVNKKVMAMFEKVEEYNDLMSKKNIIEIEVLRLKSIARAAKVAEILFCIGGVAIMAFYNGPN